MSVLNNPFVATVRSLFAGVLFVVWTIALAILVVSDALVLRRRTFQDRIIQIWACGATALFNVYVKLRGRENLLPPEQGCLFLFNHTSQFDIPIFSSVIPRSHRYGAKIELFSIPIFGAAMRAAGMLPITRSNRKKVLRLYEASIARVHQGESFVLAAEGTRLLRPGVGEKFKTGPFQFAINGQFPIVPVILRGAYDCMPKGRILPCSTAWRFYASVEVLPPIATTGYKLEELETLLLHVQKIMTNAYNQG